MLNPDFYPTPLSTIRPMVLPISPSTQSELTG